MKSGISELFQCERMTRAVYKTVVPWLTAWCLRLRPGPGLGLGHRDGMKFLGQILNFEVQNQEICHFFCCSRDHVRPAPTLIPELLVTLDTGS